MERTWPKLEATHVNLNALNMQHITQIQKDEIIQISTVIPGGDHKNIKGLMTLRI